MAKIQRILVQEVIHYPDVVMFEWNMKTLETANFS